MNQMGGMGGMSGGMMNRRGNMRQQQRMGGRMSGMNSMSMVRDRFAQPGSHYVSKTGHSVHLRGLPFQALESDISDVSVLKMLSYFQMRRIHWDNLEILFLILIESVVVGTKLELPK